MENLKQLQNRMYSLELQCMNHPNPEVRYKWGDLSEEHSSKGLFLWSEVNDESVLTDAIANAEQLLKEV